jgi:predicted PurR-regulated permease PerM
MEKNTGSNTSESNINFGNDEKKKVYVFAKAAVISAILIIIFYFCVKRYSGLKNVLDTINVVFRPFVIGFATAFILTPIMSFFERHLRNLILPRVKNKEGAKKRIRIFSSIISTVILIAMIIVFLWAVVPQIVQTLTYIFNHIEEQLVTVLDWADNITGKRFTAALTDAKQIKNIESFLARAKIVVMDYLNWGETSNMVKQITSGVIDVGKIFAQILIGLFAAIYFMIDKEKYKAILKKMLYGLCPVKVSNQVMDIMRKANDIFYGFFVGKIIDSIIIGLICYVCMLIFRMPYSVLVSVIVGVTNVIPVFGPYIGAVPTVTIIFFTNPMQGIYFLIFVIILQQLDGNVIGPKILGDSTGVSAFWVLFSIVIGGGFFGFFGMLFGVPVVALVYYILSKVFVNLAVRKDLPTETMIYENLRDVDPDTNEFVLNPKTEKKKILIFENFFNKMNKGKHKE